MIRCFSRVITVEHFPEHLEFVKGYHFVPMKKTVEIDVLSGKM